MPPTPKPSTACSRTTSSRRSTTGTTRAFPRRWLRVVKEAIRSVAPPFSTRRMVKEYVNRMYGPAMRQPISR